MNRPPPPVLSLCLGAFPEPSNSSSSSFSCSSSNFSSSICWLLKAIRISRQRLEMRGIPPLSCASKYLRFMAPKRDARIVEASHEPSLRSADLQSAVSQNLILQGQHNVIRFMVPMRAPKRMEALLDPSHSSSSSSSALAIRGSSLDVRCWRKPHA